MDDYLIFEPDDETLAEFGTAALAVAWTNACHYYNNYDPTECRPEDAR